MFFKKAYFVNTDCYITIKKSVNTLDPRSLTLTHKNKTSKGWFVTETKAAHPHEYSISLRYQK